MESKFKQHFSKRLNNYFSNYLKDKFEHSFLLAYYAEWNADGIESGLA
jgi:hypothetical protein